MVSKLKKPMAHLGLELNFMYFSIIDSIVDKHNQE